MYIKQNCLPTDSELGAIILLQTSNKNAIIETAIVRKMTIISTEREDIQDLSQSNLPRRESLEINSRGE